MPDERTAFGENLRAIREQQGLTQEALARMTGMSLIQIKRYESGRSEPSLDALKRISFALEVFIDDLVHWEPVPSYASDPLSPLLRGVQALPNDERAFVAKVLRALLDAHHARARSHQRR